MNRTMRWIAGGALGAAAIAAAALGAATAFAGADVSPAVGAPSAGGYAAPVNDQEVPIVGDDLAAASAAALAAVGGGTVTQTEVGDEESYYEVEVTFADGHQVDVQLDQNFNLVETMADGEGSGR